MTHLQPHVVPLFATPFGLVSLPNAAALNPVVASLFAGRATASRAGVTARQALTPHQALMFRSGDDVLDYPDEPVRLLTRGIIDAAIAVVRSLNDFSDEQFATLRLQARAWFSIVKPDGHVAATNYPNAAWCAVYCVAAPEPTTRFDSGVLRLHAPLRASMFPDATNSVSHIPYQPAHSTWRPLPGEVAVFPASITHEIALLRAAPSLVLITALLRFLGPEQMGMPW